MTQCYECFSLKYTTAESLDTLDYFCFSKLLAVLQTNSKFIFIKLIYFIKITEAFDPHNTGLSLSLFKFKEISYEK